MQTASSFTHYFLFSESIFVLYYRFRTNDHVIKVPETQAKQFAMFYLSTNNNYMHKQLVQRFIFILILSLPY